jgi:hypothetical protein
MATRLDNTVLYQQNKVTKESRNNTIAIKPYVRKLVATASTAFQKYHEIE